jgi:hypothetical protein
MGRSAPYRIGTAVRSEFIAIVGDLSGYADARAPGRTRGPGAGPARFGPPHRQPASPQELQPAAAPHLLFGRPDSHDAPWALTRVLPAETF